MTIRNELSKEVNGFDPAEFLDRIACGEYRGNLSELVDRLTDGEKLAAALLYCERVEADRKRRQAAESAKRQPAKQAVCLPAYPL